MKLQGTMQINSQGRLVIGGCVAVELAGEFGTPLYVLDEEHFRSNCRDYYRAFTDKYDAEVIYASKTLFGLAVCQMVKEEGLGLDIVSGGELYTAARVGFPMEKVYFHGNNKSPEELAMALQLKVGRFMVDNLRELDLLSELAGRLNTSARVILRVSPGVEAHTHEYIKTGQIDSKFGLALSTGQAMEGVQRALQLDHIELVGLHCHIGSQIFELASYTHAAEVMMNFAVGARELTGWVAEELDLGGGLGIYYFQGDEPPSVRSYADNLMAAVKRLAREKNLPEPRVIVEPGRSISGPAGTTLYTVGTIKDIPGVRKYVSVDGGMVDNPRPALYQSKYEAMVANKAALPAAELVSIAGKCCESGDMLIWDISLPVLEPGDILAVSNTGAYNYTMSSNYNRLPRPAMVLVKDGQADVIIQRETYEDLLRNDVVPERLKPTKTLTVASVR